MRIVVQRVSHAQVCVEGNEVGRIGHGLLVLIGIEDADRQTDADALAEKLVKLRIFDDERGVMNLSLLDTHGEMLVVSQFTLMASTRKGNRPSYIRASRPEFAIPLYEYFCQRCTELLARPVATGQFGADMQVSLCNDGPVTILLDTHTDL
ncbi:D-tyrosyl-tRNA(Tyr) deacylase [Porphyromonas crevioricanis]|uniref:D-aminoacyl-tRNA deacylase n=2 Tax=Porphyromonas crevioricanis TaxID=393921 RepID=A0A0A2G1R4_9PORP|nr:D-aminoacyl-tRNA deacylase [Porphyromonas crevioricanis]KGN90262.1 D-tyrosyl-tRNA(Tyr) deacylase [Porphyromonas crevioricanis]KGN96362.1 D-tyrosyl-tRNA(Tyr) deacylase [Porphyromonas crevioricanis]SJZ95823.1 D-tyrosyl-tRNA(Tyr) deacylase [Porphyromonas crevioricanis]SQH72698.1 D-tyrosyl-tRNA(Tyr) deacylase [Porphyromonas crevioricanis]GAD06201.1 D-tyrosyl-tRNA(Tyr) deacylase [Porphyromonas crevioricanis JCM 15906]